MKYIDMVLDGTSTSFSSSIFWREIIVPQSIVTQRNP